MQRRLSLKSEHLSDLTTAELEAVGGAGPLPTQMCTGYYRSINAPCTTTLVPATTGTTGVTGNSGIHCATGTTTRD